LILGASAQSGSEQLTAIQGYTIIREPSKAFDMAGLGGCTRTGMTFAKPVFVPRQQVIDFRYTQPDADGWALADPFSHGSHRGLFSGRRYRG